MTNSKRSIGSSLRDWEDTAMDPEEAAGLFFDAWNGPTFSDPDCTPPDEREIPKLRGSRAEQQLLFSQLYDLFTEPFVDPMLGLFHVRKRKQEIIH